MLRHPFLQLKSKQNLCTSLSFRDCYKGAASRRNIPVLTNYLSIALLMVVDDSMIRLEAATLAVSSTQPEL